MIVIPDDLPTLNASLNSVAAILLTTGYLLIRLRRTRAHVVCMVGALVASALFLTSYLVYHYLVGSKPYAGPASLVPIYRVILISHIILAAAIVPLVIMTVTRALKRQFERHKKIARVTLPLWIYVSVTGVIVYVMLYVLPARGETP